MFERFTAWILHEDLENVARLCEVVAGLEKRLAELEKQRARLETLEGAVATLQASERKAIATAVQKRAWQKQARMLEATDGFRVHE